MPILDFSVTAAHYVGAHIITGHHYILSRTASVGYSFWETAPPCGRK